MKIRAIRLENIRRFVEPVEIRAIGDGLNVLTAPNERGKSTFFDALHAVFFKDRKSWDKQIRSLVPHAGGAPSVVVEIELPEGVYAIEKHWNSRRTGDARILSGGQLLKQADEAESWIAEILKAPQDGGPAGLLWVRQGQSGLDDGQNLERARRDLLSSVAGEVEVMTGGRQMDMALDLCSSELLRYQTPTGRVRADGPLKRHQDDVAALREDHAELKSKSIDLQDELERRRELRRTLDDLEDPDEEEARKRRIVEAEAEHEEAARHHQTLERAQEAERAREAESERASEKLEALEKNLAEVREAGTELGTAKQDEAETIAEKGRAESNVSELEQAHVSARADAETAAETLRLAMRAEAAASVEERRRELTEQLGKAEELRQQEEQATAAAKTEISDDVLAELEGLDEELRVLRKTRDIEATAITMEYVSGRHDGVLLEGLPLADGKRTPVRNRAVLEIEDLGQLTVHPGKKADPESLAEAEARLASALEEASVESLEAARASEQRRHEVEERARDAKATLKGIAPEGIDALREHLAGLPEPLEELEDLPTVAEAQDADDTAARALDQARGRVEAARLELAHADAKAARAGATVEAAEGRMGRAEAALSRIEEPEKERNELRRAVDGLRAAHDEAKRRSEALAAKVPDLEAAEAKLERARGVAKHAGDERQRIRVDLGKLDTTIGIRAGEAVEEELSDVAVRLEAAEGALDELNFEIDVLQELKSALEGARESARDRYVEPVLKELKPLLGLLWPEAELRFDADEVLPAALERGGMEEDFDVLSGGTQEQIALLVRLAFARMLARAGSPAPVILDDGIVYTDDDRIERMFDALTRQAHDLQIIVLSCRQRAFRALGGQALEIVPVHERP